MKCNICGMELIELKKCVIFILNRLNKFLWNGNVKIVENIFVLLRCYYEKYFKVICIGYVFCIVWG